MTTPMSAERFADRFRFYRDQPQQLRGVLQLHAAISSSDQGNAILDEQAPWAVTFSEQPPQPPAPTGGLDPRGAEEGGMAGPQMAAHVQPGDTYLLVNDRDEDMEAYDHTGQFLWKVPCLARGQGSDTDWTQNSTDTPRGLYRLGQLYADYELNPNPPCSDTAMGYGWYSFDMEELEGQEAGHGRAGIMLMVVDRPAAGLGPGRHSSPCTPPSVASGSTTPICATRCCPSTARAPSMWGCSRKKSDGGPGPRGVSSWGVIPGPRQPAALAGVLLQQRRHRGQPRRHPTPHGGRGLRFPRLHGHRDR